MAASTPERPIRVAFIGTGAVTAYHHLPGLRLDSRAELVAICDTDPEILARRKAEWNVGLATTEPEELCRWEEVDAVVIATPNDTHRPIAVGAAKAGKHVMCEKPLGLSATDVRQMYEAARDAGVVHMTAFTYRFAPSMRYLRHLLKSGCWNTSPLPLSTLPGLARNELGLAAVSGSGGCGRPLRHDHPPHRLRHRLARPDLPRLRGDRPVRTPRPDGRRPALSVLRC